MNGDDGMTFEELLDLFEDCIDGKHGDQSKLSDMVLETFQASVNCDDECEWSHSYEKRMADRLIAQGLIYPRGQNPDLPRGGSSMRGPPGPEKQAPLPAGKQTGEQSR
jgi:hypothetical protein